MVPVSLRLRESSGFLLSLSVLIGSCLVSLTVSLLLSPKVLSSVSGFPLSLSNVSHNSGHEPRLESLSLTLSLSLLSESLTLLLSLDNLFLSLSLEAGDEGFETIFSEILSLVSNCCDLLCLGDLTLNQVSIVL